MKKEIIYCPPQVEILNLEAETVFAASAEEEETYGLPGFEDEAW